MIIKFVTEKSDGDCDHGIERHTVLVDDVEFMSQFDWICPEDVKFFRDLSSPHDCKDVIKAVIAAVKRGEEIKFKNVIVENF